MRIILLSVCIMLITQISNASKSEDVYTKFGPKLIESAVSSLLDEINTLRKELGLPKIKEDDFLDKINEKEESIEDYEWMKKSRERIQ